ncbi:MAG: DPP IV N-terminal domain-containing protein [Bacteroidales bacterium]|nr:DPP IV N-terminal domain-containing protein [Bacteroidales bacterium]
MKNKIFRILLIPAFAIFFSQYTFSQKVFTPADYEQADSLADLFNKKVFHSVQKVNWVKDKPVFWYSTLTMNGKEFWTVNAERLTKERIFKTDSLLLQLTDMTKKPVKNEDFSPVHPKLSGDANLFTFQMDTMLFAWDRSKKELKLTGSKPVDKPEGYWGERAEDHTGPPVKSPDGNWIAFIRENNVFVKDSLGKTQVQLSFDGSVGDYYSAELFWSPDSKKLAGTKVRAEIPHYIYFVESSPSDQLQPKLQKRFYPKAGDALPISSPVLFDIEEKKQIEVDGTPFLNQFTMGNLEWRKDNRAFTFEFNQRGHQRYQVVEVNAASGDCKVLIDEKSKTFIDYSSKLSRHDVDDGREIIWTSERDGWNHMYLYNGFGILTGQITSGEWVVRDVVKVFDSTRQIIFTASGKNPGEDPYQVHYYRTDFEGANMKELTPLPANHQAEFSTDYRFMTDIYSRVDMPPTTVLRDAVTGKILLIVEQADISDLKSIGWKLPEVFSAKGRDGITDIWGMIYRPTSFDSTKKYPIIEYIYAGPHSSFVPKNFSASYRTYAALAELGFIVVQIDGMGTSNRSKAFHDVCWRNLKDAGFPDRILWIKAAARKYAYMDTTRVGIFGGSAGGQSSTGALLFHPDFYKAAVSSCGCHDNRMDKIWWNEQWMGYPVGPWYADNSNVTNAHFLKGNLMLLVGELDDNVDPASTIQLCDALIKADKDFELVMLPGMNHTGGGKYGERKRRDFFVKNLLNAIPPVWNEE